MSEEFRRCRKEAPCVKLLPSRTANHNVPMENIMADKSVSTLLERIVPKKAERLKIQKLQKTDTLDDLILLGEVRALVRVLYACVKNAKKESLDDVAGSDIDGADLVSLAFAAVEKLDLYHRIANAKALSHG